jgi:zinc transporter 5/7
MAVSQLSTVPPSCAESQFQDTLGSVGVIISTLLIQFFGWTGFDPIASLFIAVLIAMSVIPLVVDTGRILALDVGDRERCIRRALAEVRQFGSMWVDTNTFSYLL